MGQGQNAAITHFGTASSRASVRCPRRRDPTRRGHDTLIQAALTSGKGEAVAPPGLMSAAPVLDPSETSSPARLPLKRTVARRVDVIGHRRAAFDCQDNA